MKRIIFLVILFICIAGYAHAGSLTFTWDAPTTNTDNTCVVDHNFFTLHWGAVTGTYPDNINITGSIAENCTDSGIDAGTGCGNIMNCSYTATDILDGTYFFVLTSTDFNDNWSAPSNEVTATIDAVRHNPVTNFGVTH